MITDKIKKQIKFWQIYSVVAPLGFIAISSWLRFNFDISLTAIIELAGVATVSTCVVWWHWSMVTMLTLMSVVSKADSYFGELDKKLSNIQNSLQD